MCTPTATDARDVALRIFTLTTVLMWRGWTGGLRSDTAVKKRATLEAVVHDQCISLTPSMKPVAAHDVDV
jgi:hypothetical protein